MEGIKSNATNVSERSGAETEVKIEVKEETYVAIDGICSEVITGNIEPAVLPETYEVRRPEQCSQYYEGMLPSTYDKCLPLRCRLCASQGIDMVDMLAPDESDKNILEKIEQCLPIVVKETDPLPKQACRLCLANLELCYQFHKTVAEAETQLLAFDRLASRQLEETEKTKRNDENFQTCEGQRSASEYDDLKGPLATTSDVETNDDESTSVLEQARTKYTPVMSNVVSLSLKYYPEMLFPTETINKNNRTISSGDSVYQNEDSLRNIFDSWRIPAPQNTQQSRYDFVYPEMSDRSQAHKDMIPSLYYGMEFPHLRTKKENLAIHDPAQTRKEPYSCRVCAKMFKSKTGRDNHVRTHTGEGLHSCKYCDKKFSLKGNRDYHHRIHTGERPFKCSICAKTFAWVSSLYEHASVHSKDRNHHCSVCNKSFKLLRARNRHMISHAGEQA